MTESRAPRYLWLDMFRGLAALVVVLHHNAHDLGLPHLRFGFLSVDMFFVLSGIVLGARYTARIESGMSLGAFAWQRLRRLYPMVLIVAALIVAMDMGGLPGEDSLEAAPGALLPLVLVTPYHWSSLQEYAFSADRPMWSLWAELASNLAWFGALRLGRRMTAAIFFGSMMLFAVLALRNGNFDFGWCSDMRDHVRGLVRALAWFGVGYWIALRRPVVKLPVGVLVALLVALCAASQLGSLNPTIVDFLIVLCGTTLLVRLMQQREPTGPMATACTWLGMVSFPIYLLHVPAHRLASWMATHGLPIISADIIAIGGVAIAATVLNEAIVERLPRELRFRRVTVAA
jgi:peptidoglycan/LPS O-acetylase OafA/YrhL